MLAHDKRDIDVYTRSLRGNAEVDSHQVYTVSVPRRLRWRQPHSWLSCHTLRSLVRLLYEFLLSLPFSLLLHRLRYAYGFVWVNVAWIAPFRHVDRIFVTPLTCLERSHDLWTVSSAFNDEAENRDIDIHNTQRPWVRFLPTIIARRVELMKRKNIIIGTG